MKTWALAAAMGAALLFQFGAQADPAFDFHSGPCAFASPASGSLGPVSCRILVALDISAALASPPAIGGTTPNSGAFTTLAAGNSSITGPLTVGDGANLSLQVAAPNGASWPNYLFISGNTTGNSPLISATSGVNANVPMTLSSKGNGTIFFQTEGTQKTQFAIIDNPSGVNYVTAASGSSAASLNTNSGNMILGSAAGTTTLSDVSLATPNIPSSGSALDAVCWNAASGLQTHNTSGALCSASLEELKDNLGGITAADADTDLMELRPFWGKFKESIISISDHRVQPFLGARQVESIDPRLAEYDDEGALHSVRYANLTALLIAGYQFQASEIASLKSRISALEAR